MDNNITPHLGLKVGSPSCLRVPDGYIGILPHHRAFEKVLEAFTGLERERSWFVPHAYRCLPLTMGNQIGFAVRTFYPFEVSWRGGEEPKSVIVKIDDGVSPDLLKLQSVEPHFGMGTFTLQYRATLRTPPGVNLMVLPPPNQAKRGVWPMTAVVETDNLRRDFTYNIRLTEVNQTVRYESGEMVAALLPIPRGFPDSFKLADLRGLCPADVIAEEFAAQGFASYTRSQIDPAKPYGVGRMYLRGLDPYGHPFPGHQMKPGSGVNLDDGVGGP